MRQGALRLPASGTLEPVTDPLLGSARPVSDENGRMSRDGTALLLTILAILAIVAVMIGASLVRAIALLAR